MMCQNRKMISFMEKASVRDSPEQWIPTTNIFINYIPKAWTKTELIDLFQQFGIIESAKVMIDLNTGASKCFGFVRFSNINSADTAVLNVNGMKVEGKRLLARFAGCVENTGSPTHTIYIKSLPLAMTQKQLCEMYQVFGTIRSLDYVTDPKTNRFTGSAYIAYTSVFSAKCAVRETNNLTLTPTAWPLFIRYVDDSYFDKRQDEKVVRGIIVERRNTNNSISKKTPMGSDVLGIGYLTRPWTHAI